MAEATAAPRATLIEDLSVTVASEPLSMDQVITAALFGGSFTVPDAYDSTKTYSKNDKITRTNENGTPVIYVCKTSGTTGTFDSTKWAVYSLFDSNSGTADLTDGSAMAIAIDNQLVASIVNL